MRNPITVIRDLLLPPRIPDDEFKRIVDMTHETTETANRLADEFERIERKAMDENRDPLSVLIREVKSASFKRAVR